MHMEQENRGIMNNEIGTFFKERESTEDPEHTLSLIDDEFKKNLSNNLNNMKKMLLEIENSKSSNVADPIEVNLTEDFVEESEELFEEGLALSKIKVIEASFILAHKISASEFCTNKNNLVDECAASLLRVLKNIK